MKLSRFLFGLVFATIVALVYIQLQVQIYDLAYQGKSKERAMRKLLDENSHTTYRICLLKSANNLGVKLLAENSQMCFLDNNHVLPLTDPSRMTEKADLASLPRTESPTGFLQNIFSLKSQAEAKPLR